MNRPALGSLRDRRILVTGAASGIGRATAIALGREGAVVYLTDRNGESLAAVVAEIEGQGGIVGHAEQADLADYEQVRAMGEEIHLSGFAMDVVMNVAGVSTWGTVENLAHHHWQTMVDINLMGPIHVMETFLPPMIAAGRGGHLVNVSSAAGLVGLPWHAAYSASKFGLRGVSEVLRFDLRRHGIGVSLVCPGGVATPLTRTVEIVGVDRQRPEFERLHHRFTRHAISPEKAARAIIDGVKQNKYLVFTSNDIRALHLVQRWCPPIYELIMQELSRRVNLLLPADPAPAVGVSD